MKIAVCIRRLAVGGLGVSSHILAKGLRDLGHQVDLLVTDWYPGADYERAAGDGWPINAICEGERWLRRRMATTWDVLRSYDAVIDNSSTETRLIAPALPAKIIRFSIVRGVLPRVIREAANCAPGFHAMVGISPEVTRLMEAAGVRAPIRLVPNAVRIHGTGRSALQNPLRLAYLGRLDDMQKNIFVLPAVLRACLDAGHEVRLTVAGDGKYRSRLLTLFRKKGVADSVEMVGAIPHPSVSDFFRSHSMAIFPSRFEGFGLTLAEAMGVGCVPIASSIPSYRWILGAQAADLTVPTDDASAYARTVTRLATDPRVYQAMQAQAISRQQAMFTPSATVSQYEALLREFQGRAHIDPVPFADLSLDWFSRLRCNRGWYAAQRIKALWTGRGATAVNR